MTDFRWNQGCRTGNAVPAPLGLRTALLRAAFDEEELAAQVQSRPPHSAGPLR